ncbi:unnamed protein product [Rhizophagus irregularis]|nr:unnamed protein product [Rhizophagus irregularis]
MKNGHNSEETYFVPLIPWHSNEAVKIHNIIDAEDECQCQLKLCKGSAGGGVINFYKHVSVTLSNKPKFFRLASFIPKCSTSSTFLQWTIKSTSQIIQCLCLKFLGKALILCS